MGGGLGIHMARYYEYGLIRDERERGCTAREGMGLEKLWVETFSLCAQRLVCILYRVEGVV